MQNDSRPEHDPLVSCLALSLLFFLLAIFGLGTPARLYFDEYHYIPAARELLELRPVNQEHPLFAKQVLAASILLFGDQPWAWRLPSLLFGTFGLFCLGRLVWEVTRRRAPAILTTLLVATNFLWFIQARIGMLDIFAASLLLASYWQTACAVRVPDQARMHLACAGLLLGLSLGAKWSVAPYAPMPLVGLAIMAWIEARSPPLTPHDNARTTAAMIPGLTAKATWLGLLPLGIYWATFWPTYFYDGARKAITPADFFDYQLRMMAAQRAAIMPHPHQSTWVEWIFNLRPIWYLYEHIDGAWRGVILVGNPVSMLAGLAAFLCCVQEGLRKRRRDCIGFALLYVLGLCFWPLSGKPVQFYYHYLLPATFLMVCLALAIEEMAKHGPWGRWMMYVTSGTCVATFIGFYPVISAIALPGDASIVHSWIWLKSWR